MMAFNRRDIEFLYELGSLKNIQRGWRQHVGMDVENVLEHTFRMLWIALILARREKVKNEEKILKMVMVHDLAEIRTVDLSYVQKVYVEADEAPAVHDTFAKTSLEDFEQAILREYNERRTREAKIVKDADNIEVDLEIRELAERGSQLPRKWKQFRRLVRQKKLYTTAAKDLWDMLDAVDIADWHIKTNKWVKLPSAGT